MNKAAWILFALSLVPIGCTSVNKASQTIIQWRGGTNTFAYTSSKDLTLKKLTIDPNTGVITIEGISAQVDQAAVQAAQAARANDSLVVLEALKLAADAAKKAP